MPPSLSPTNEQFADKCKTTDTGRVREDTNETTCTEYRTEIDGPRVKEDGGSMSSRTLKDYTDEYEREVRLARRLTPVNPNFMHA